MKYSLNKLAAALTLGLMTGLGLAIMTCVAVYTGYATHILELIEGVYPWYAVSYIGACWGLVWGFMDGFIGGFILVAVYNFFVKKLAKK